MKAGTLSINLHSSRLNYGAVLHSWYFQKMLMRRDDIELCEILDYCPPTRARNNDTYFLRLKESRSPLSMLMGLAMTPGFILRDRRFKRFFREHLTVSKAQYTAESFETAHLPYDVIFFESDVIWSPKYNGGDLDPVFFGKPAGMAPVKKIVYSASMGAAALTEKNYAQLDELLQYPDAISMRETYASELVRQHTDKPVADVLDPVLLGKPSDYDEITAPRRIHEPYLLLYYPIRPSSRIRSFAHDFAKARGLKVVEVSNFTHNKLHHKTITAAGIEDFLSLVRNADAVFSNSLHGTCLSVLFHKEFYAFAHGRGKALKYRDLCEKLGLMSQFVSSEVTEFTPAGPIEWDAVDQRLDVLRKASLDWLEQAIEMCKAK